MNCPLCELVVGERYEAIGVVYCGCGASCDITGGAMVYMGLTPSYKHLFTTVRDHTCECGEVLSIVVLPCQDSCDMRAVRELFRLPTKIGVR